MATPLIPLTHWKPGEYVPAASHDADSRPFYERQQERIKRMQQDEKPANVSDLPKRRTK